MFSFSDGGHWPPSFFIFSFALLAGAGPALAQREDSGAPLLRGGAGAEDPRAYRSPAGSAIPAYGAPGRPVSQELLYDSSTLAPNYGKPRRPRDKRSAYTGRKPVAAKTLPPLETYRTAPAGVRVAPGARAAGASSAPPATNFAATPGPPPQRRPRVDDDPYAPLGLVIGGLRLTPYAEAQAGYDSNPNRTRNGEGSAMLRGDVGFAAQSDWSRHSLNAQANASYFSFTSLPDASRPEANASAALRLDVLRDTFANFELRGALVTQRPGSPDVPGATINQPVVGSFGATTGVTQRFGRTEASVSFLADRRFYGDAELNGGGIARLSADNYNAWGLRGRIGHELTPGVKPFIEVGGDIRRRDEPIDLAGYARDSSGVQARAGSTFELTRTLTGEASAGYAQRRYEDARLPVLAGPTLDARLIWSATALTSVTLRAATEFNETTIANASGAVSRRLSADVSHALMRNLTLGAGVSFSDTAYKGVAITEQTLAGALRADYSFNRNLVLRGSYAHERLWSSQPGAGYGAHVFLLGLRIQP
ncbi:MAG: outer membrane beta-barrel protein [Beijerinckiaceae bacterium]|nr:outer membrane beta-barrel protein [Beijerinckiaceae bacterium]